MARELQKIRDEQVRHNNEDKNFQTTVGIDIMSMKGDLNDIKNNHLAHIEPDVREIKTNQAWLMRFFWIVATASIGAFIAAIWDLINK